jgi:hypothetical protein
VEEVFVSLILAKSETTNLILDFDSDRQHNIRTTAVRMWIRTVWWLRRDFSYFPAREEL